MSGYVFYSSNNSGCYNLMKIMENEGMLNMFTLKSIDDMSENEIVKLGLRSVPTIVFVNNGQKGIYEKEDAFKWVNNIIANRRQNIMKRTENNRKLIQQNSIQNIKNGLFEYNANESQGISDSYSYWKDDINQDINTAQPKSFLPFGRDSQYTIMTIPENKNNIHKLDKDSQNKMVANLKNTRDRQDEQIKDIFTNEQIDKVLKYNNNII